jgi:hypothetical protein
MGKDEARKLLDAWDFFDKHAEAKSWEGFSRQRFYLTMQVITGEDDLTKAYSLLEKIASGQSFATVPGTIVEKTKEANLSPARIETIRQTTNTTRAWINKTRSTATAELNVKKREAAKAATLAEKVVVEKEKEVETKATEIKKEPIKETAEVKVVKPAYPEVKTEGGILKPVVIEITNQEVSPSYTESSSAGMFLAAARKIPDTNVGTTVTKSALLLSSRGVSSDKLYAKALTMPEGNEKSFLLFTAQSVKEIETLYPNDVAKISEVAKVNDFQIYFLKPEATVSQNSLLFSPSENGYSLSDETGAFEGFAGFLQDKAVDTIVSKVENKVVEKLATTQLGKTVAGFTAKTIGTAAVSTGAKAAVTTGFGAKIAALFGASSVGGPIGWIIAAVTTLLSLVPMLVSWLARKFKQNPEMLLLLGLPLMGLGLFFGSPLIAIGGLAALVGGGVAAGSIAAALARLRNAFLFGLTNFIFPGIGLPLLITFIGIPVLIVFILYIINTSAYVVPPFRTGGIPENCISDTTTKPTATSVLYSDDGRYAFPVDGVTDAACYHWDGQLNVDVWPQTEQAPVLAYTSGTIYMISTSDPKGGKYIILQGNDGRYYYYAHNCSLFVKAGDTVSVGDVIATTDSTGSAANTGAHLHFSISVFPNFIHGGTVCPSTDFTDKFSSYTSCPPEKQCKK